MDEGKAAVGDGRTRRQRTFIAALLLAVLAAGCGGVVRFGDLDPPEGRQMVVAVEIRGNAAISDGTIVDGLSTYDDNLSFGSAKPLLDRADLSTDARRIESLYAEHGYFDARVTGYEVTTDPSSPGLVRVAFAVVEGEPTRVARIEITDLTTLPTQDPEAPERLRAVSEAMGKLVRVRAGDVWSEAKHLEAKERIGAALRERGFLYAIVLSEVLVERETRRASVEYRIAPGPLTRVSEVRIVGNDRVPAERIQRRVQIASGDIVEPARLGLTERQIYRLRVFFGVSAKPIRKSLREQLGDAPATFENVRAIEWERAVPIEIAVQEMPIHELSTGVGATIGNERSDAYVRAGYQNRDLFGGLRFLDFQVRPGLVVMPKFWSPNPLLAPGGDIDLMFRQPSFIEEYTDLGLHGNYQLLVDFGYRAHKVLGSPSVSRTWFGWLTTSLSYNVLYIQYFSFAGALERPRADELGVSFNSESLLTWWEQLVEVDFRDNIYDPRRGVYASARLVESLEATGSDYHYFRLLTNVRAYWSPWSWLTLAWQATYGQTFSPFGSDTPLPARFQAGGPSDMRGFGAGQMGPYLCDTVQKDADGNAVLDSNGDEIPITLSGWDDQCDGSAVFVGGELMLTANFEARFYLPANFGLVAFVDAGEVWATKGEVDVTDVNVAVGPGLRYYTPFGPVRLDVGVGVTAPRIGAYQVHFSIGQAF